MNIDFIDNILSRLAELISQHRFEELETDTLEIKTVPSDGATWRERHKSVCAFLNTRGGIVIFGVKEEGKGAERRYVFTGWQPHAEPNLKEIQKQFTDRAGTVLDLTHAFPPPMIRAFMGGSVALFFADELPADEKFVFYHGDAFKRIVTGDHKITDAEIEAQEEFKEEALHARELQPVSGLTEADLDLDKLNKFIFHLNQPVPIETMKSGIDQARAFLERRCFIKDGSITTLGALVCAGHPGDHLGFRAQLHGYVDAPQEVARDKQDFVDNVLQLMDSGLGYLLRNIQVGISRSEDGESGPEYPREVLAETVNNALAHRDYSIDRQVIVAVKPGSHVSIQNPGSFRGPLLVQRARGPGNPIPIHRILPEAKPRNPKLADVLRVFRKWEGRGIGMATLVNLALADRIGLPYYNLGTEEVTLYITAGPLVDERMMRLFKGYERFISDKLSGNELSKPQQRVLSYLIKSEWANELLRYSILLTPDNNHFGELVALELAGLIEKHPAGTDTHPVYVADRTLMRKDYLAELRELFGGAFDALDPLAKDILGVVFRFNNYSSVQTVSAKEASFQVWAERDDAGGIKEFDAFYRKVRNVFNKLQKAGFVKRRVGTHGYELDFKSVT